MHDIKSSREMGHVKLVHWVSWLGVVVLIETLPFFSNLTSVMLLCIWIALCISVSPLFKEHLYSGDTFWERGCPMYESSLRVCISCPYWMETSIQGTVILVKWVSHKWRLHCRIMFVSITSIEGTSPFRGHLSWSPECPLNGGSTVRPHFRTER